MFPTYLLQGAHASPIVGLTSSILRLCFCHEKCLSFSLKKVLAWAVVVVRRREKVTNHEVLVSPDGGDRGPGEAPRR